MSGTADALHRRCWDIFGVERKLGLNKHRVAHQANSRYVLPCIVLVLK